jgi:CheY-like chemotaxis protein
MGSRHEKRTRIQTQVRIFGTDRRGNPFTRLADTIDVSPSGVRMAGVYVELYPGDELDVEADAGLGRFRVVWQGKLGSERAGEVALSCITPGLVLWPTDEPGWRDTYESEENVVPQAPEQRLYRRFECDLVAYVTPEDGIVARFARCVDMSFGGCYLQSTKPLAAEAKLAVSIQSPSGPPISASGFVRASHPGFGMGMRFTKVEEPRVLAALLDNLRQSVPARQERPIAVPSWADAKGSSKTVLIIDDSLTMRNLAAHHLRRHGYVVLLARNGEEGVALARTHDPDLIVLDILMPRLSGLAVLRVLKSDHITAHIPVMVLTSLPEENDSRMLAEGAAAYFAKANTPIERLPQLVDRTFKHVLMNSRIEV